MKASRLQALVGWSLAAVLVPWVVLTFDWHGVREAIAQARAGIFLGVVLATWLPFFFVKTLRWRALLPEQRAHLGLLDQYLVVGSAVGMASIAPLQSVEVLKAESGHADAGLARKRAYTALAVERLLDLTAASLAFTLAYPPHLPATWRVLPMLMAAGSASALAASLSLGLVPGTSRLAEWGVLMRGLLLPLPRLLGILAATAGTWCILLVGWGGTLAAMGVVLHPQQLVALLTGIALLAVFSLVPGGLGISELGITGMLVQLGFLVPRAQGAALLVRTYGLTSALLGLALFLLYRRRRRARG